jgi:hypothetical protein
LAPAFAGVLEKLIQRNTPNEAPDSLVATVFDRLGVESGDPCIIGPIKASAARDRELEPWRAQVRTQMELLEAVTKVASLPEGAGSLDQFLAAAEEEHERLEKGLHPAIAGAPVAGDGERMPEQLRGFAGLPIVRSGRIQPGRWGPLKLGDVRGVFLEYQSCQDRCANNTLLAFDTKAEPRADVVEFRGGRYWAVRHARHAFIAWRGPKDGWLYILITHCPFKNTLALADLLRA